MSAPKSRTSFTLSITCSVITAWKSIGTPSDVIRSVNPTSMRRGCMLTSMPSVVNATYFKPVFTGVGSTPPLPKMRGFRTSTASWPASGCTVEQADNTTTETIASRDYRSRHLLHPCLPGYFLFCCTTFIAVVIIDATSDRFDGRMIVSALLITLPNSAMYCSATFS